MDSPPATPNPRGIRRVAMLFSGGPAPAANAVISTAAVALLRHGIEVIGLRNGYDKVMKYHPDRPLVEGTDYLAIDHPILKRTRNSRGILIGTARANPGSKIETYADLSDEVKTAPLKTVYDALRSLKVDALISIGGDDTLKTANKFARFQRERLPNQPPIAVVHVPKTIDNDYAGIDFTFGYFTAVEFLAVEIQNLLADGEATRSYYVAEAMGRYAGWLAYGAAIAGEASLVLSVEDLLDPKANLLEDEVVPDHPEHGTFTRKRMKLNLVIDRVIDTMLKREKEGKEFGVVVLAEGMAEYLPYEHVKDAGFDEHKHLKIANIGFGKLFAKMLAKAYKTKTGRERRIVGMQLGYEARCSAPHAFDVLLGSALGVGAFRALYEHGHDEVMVSTVGQLELRYVPFSELIDPTTMKTETRYITLNSDFHRLARTLETYVAP